MFTCTYRDTEALLQEFYYKVKMRRSIIFGWIGVVLALGCLVMYFISWEWWDLIVPIIGGYYTITQLLAPWKAVKKDLKALYYQYDGQLPEKVCTVDETGVTCRLPNEEKSLAFEDTLAVIELKRAIVVQGMETVLVLAKEGFAEGQAEQCLAHIKKSCPNCPHYKR